MTNTSFKMRRQSIALIFLASITGSVMLTSCKKDEVPASNNSNKVSNYSSDVVDKWMTMQLRLMRNATGIPNQAFSRHFVYAGVAALEAVAPGLPAHTEWTARFNGLAGLPVADHSVTYYYPANVNAALASINKSLFPNASIADKAAIDSLENALRQEFIAGNDVALINTSAQFGKDVATAVFNWSEADGFKNANAPYTPPAGPGLWVPTAPAYASAASPHWGNNRTVIVGSIYNTQVAPPVSYSETPGSPFYEMVKKVYDASQTLTQQQKDMAMFWRDVPGVTSPGHWLSILQQAIRQTNSRLDKAVVSYAITGAAVNDALITCWKAKYQYSFVRPITYIRNVMGHSSWSSYLGTPAHPEYVSAHAALSAAAGETMQELFGSVGSFTDHTYDYMGFPARTYSSFIEIGKEAGYSRLYAGIHYQPSIEAGLWMGKRVAENIFRKHQAPTSFNGHDEQ
jgi:hypothetical protein